MGWNGMRWHGYRLQVTYRTRMRMDQVKATPATGNIHRRTYALARIGSHGLQTIREEGTYGNAGTQADLEARAKVKDAGAGAEVQNTRQEGADHEPTEGKEGETGKGKEPTTP